MKQEEIDDIQEAFRKVSGNLTFIPNEYCMWKRLDESGNTVKNSKNFYVSCFNFIKNYELMENLAELRMCFDYHYSIYIFIKPNLLFEKQHKFVLYQIIGSIYEGIMLDFLEYNSIVSGNKFYAILVADSNKGNKLGLGRFVDLFHRAGFINKEWRDYIENINHARNTIHPKSFNKKQVKFGNNEILDYGMDKLIINLDRFIMNIKRKY